MSLELLRPRRRILIAGVLLLALLAAAGGVIAAVGGGPSTASAETPLAAYSALTSNKPTAASATDVRPALERVARSQPEILGENARIVHSVKTGRVVLYGAANGDVCLALASSLGSAQTSCESRTRSAAAGVYFGGPIHRFGVVPDGVDSVRFVLTSGDEQTVKVVDNFYVAPDDAVKGIFEHNGSEQIREFVPRSAAPAIGESVTDERGATTRVEPDGSVSLAGPGAKLPD